MMAVGEISIGIGALDTLFNPDPLDSVRDAAKSFSRAVEWFETLTERGWKLSYDESELSCHYYRASKEFATPEEMAAELDQLPMDCGGTFAGRDLDNLLASVQA